jgi:hypothetical protein
VLDAKFWQPRPWRRSSTGYAPDSQYRGLFSW